MGGVLEDNAFLGMYDVGKRYYDPLTSSWIGRDPARQFTSPHVYCGSNSIRCFDDNGGKGLLSDMKMYGAPNHISKPSNDYTPQKMVHLN